MIWAAAALLSLLIIALVLRPMLLARRGGPGAGESRLAIYRDQLKELEREQQDGLLGKDEAAAVRLEIERRMLAAPDGDTTPTGLPIARRAVLAIPVAILLLAGPLALYLSLGQPTLSERSTTARGVPSGQMPDVATAVTQLRARLASNPEDWEGWSLLGRTEMTLGDADAAVEAFGRALAQPDKVPTPRRAELFSALGEAQVQAAEGTVGPAAIRSFGSALAIAPRDPRARFYLALGHEQQGDDAGAMQQFVEIVRTSPPDAPWVPTVREKALQLAASLGRDPRTIGLDGPQIAAGPLQSPNASPNAGPGASARPAPNPSPGQVAAMANRPPEEQQAMIRSMVAGLAERLKQSPDDIEGWIRLGRSYTVLGERDKAREALGEAAKRAPQNPEVLTAYARAIYAPEDSGQPPPPEFIAVMRQLLALDGSAPEPLWFVANAEAESGNMREARELLDRLLAQMPPGAPGRAAVQGRIDALRAGPRRPSGG